MIQIPYLLYAYWIFYFFLGWSLQFVSFQEFVHFNSLGSKCSRTKIFNIYISSSLL